MRKPKIRTKGADNKPIAWIKCSMCCGTGYVFSDTSISHRDRIRGVVASMTNDKCDDCLGSGFIEFMDD